MVAAALAAAMLTADEADPGRGTRRADYGGTARQARQATPTIMIARILLRHLACGALTTTREEQSAPDRTAQTPGAPPGPRTTA